MKNASFRSLKMPGCLDLSPFVVTVSRLNFFPGRISNATVKEMHQNKNMQSKSFAFLTKTTALLRDVYQLTGATTISYNQLNPRKDIDKICFHLKLPI